MQTQTQQTITERSYAGEADLQAICDLLGLCSSVDNLDNSRSAGQLRIEFDSPRLDKARDIRLWEDAGGRLVGFGHLQMLPDDNTRTDGYLHWRVHPEARASDLGNKVIAWASGRVREVGQERNQPARVRTHAIKKDTYSREVLDRNGFPIERYSFRMARPLDEPIPEPQFPEGYTMRHSTGSGQDIERWVDTFNQSFIDLWNFHPTSVEDEKHWLSDPRYSPEGDLIAIAPDGTFAAFCLCWIDPEENERDNRTDGWIELLGTRRGHRNKGLGRAILLSGLNYLKSQGMTVAKLGVAADNPTGALRLYESAGFKTIITSLAYHKDL